MRRIARFAAVVLLQACGGLDPRAPGNLGPATRVPPSQLKLGAYLADLDELIEHFSPGRKVTLVVRQPVGGDPPVPGGDHGRVDGPVGRGEMTRVGGAK